MSIPEEEASSILTLTDEDGNEVQFEFLDVVEYEGEEYLVLLPLDEDNNEVIILLIQPVSEDEENYVPVEDNETLQTVYAIFKEKFKDILTFDD
ncbi:MAG: DUF1292 domain-containing protein [Clostridia bacterium]|nr:DUF1292 domain-containing protein [Clostridia bacterium]